MSMRVVQNFESRNHVTEIVSFSRWFPSLEGVQCSINVSRSLARALYKT